MTGVGGGSLMTPILILVFGIHPATAVGTDLLYASVTKASGSVVHGYNRTVDWRVVGRLAIGSVPATALTIAALYFLHVDSKATQLIITRVLGAALLFTAISLLLRKPIMRWYSANVPEMEPDPRPQPDDPDRRRTRRAGVAVVGWRGRHRRDGAGSALSENGTTPHRRLRHRPCRAADARRRHRPFIPWRHRLAHLGLAARRAQSRPSS